MNRLGTMTGKINSGKQIVDDERHASERILKPGQHVLLKNTKMAGKLITTFETEPFIIAKYKRIRNYSEISGRS